MLLVALINDEVAGCAAIDVEDINDCPYAAATPWICCVFTHPTYRRRGICKMLINQLLEVLRVGLGWKWVWLWTPDQCMMYERCFGFRIIEQFEWADHS